MAKDKYQVTLRLLMEQRKLSQRALARLSHVTQPTISRILRGIEFPDHTTLEKLARGLRISLPQLTGDLPVDADETAYVLKVMQELPPYKRDMLVAAAKSLAEDP
jgi:transcriptional regulator with XRE-family HTH domain